LTFTDEEPAVTSGTIVALVTAVIALAVAFGAPITSMQKEAIIGVVGVVAPMVAVLLTRPHVTPTSKIAERIAEARVQAAEVARIRS
jgi:predicted exporter